jgi:hypothetical protein
MSKQAFIKKIAEHVEKISECSEKYKMAKPASMLIYKHLCSAMDHLIVAQSYKDKLKQEGMDTSE